jgi:phospholipid/cholesterol/gamma-HCH transport system substrate-binding protein
MIARKYETIVGIFVVASLAALLIMVVIVAQQEGLFQEYIEYRAIFKNVSGLKSGSEVHLAGVTVGNVLNTVITPDGSIVVTFQVIKKYSDRIRQDSKATIGFMGLLVEKSLDLTPGSLNKPPIPPEGIVAAIEPLDITQIVAQAAPSLQDLQKVMTNLVNLTQSMSQPDSNFGQIVTSFKEIFAKVNKGKGSLGKLVNDDVLYQDTAETMKQVRKFIEDVAKGKGLFGTLVNDPAFRDQAIKTMAELQSSFANFNKITADVKEATARLPDISKKLERFVVNLDRAGQGLPGLITQGETTLGDFDTTTKAFQKSWLLRRYVPQPQEHTIRMDAEPGKD